MRRMTMIGASVLFLAMALMMGERAEAQVNAGVLFLRIAAGARAAGMGETFVALANDASATHWNPAGLGAYPLNNEWDEFDIPSYGTVIDAAAVDNGLPHENYAAFDLWILTDKGLMVVGSKGQGGGRTSIKISTFGVGSVSAAVRRYAPFLKEKEADAIAAAAAANMIGFQQDELERLLTRVTDAIPDEYRDRTLVENTVRQFRLAYHEARLNPARLPDVRAALAALPDTGAADTDALDRARFTLEHAVGNSIPSSIQLPLTALFTPPIRAIASDGKTLYVGDADRLLSFDGDRWDLVSPPDGSDWSSEGVNCIVVSGGSRLWVGTNNGLLTRVSGTWKRYGVADGLPDARVTALAIRGLREGWVVTDKGLAVFDGEKFSADITLKINVGDSLFHVLHRFLDNDDPIAVAHAEDVVRTLNGFASDFQPEAGSEIRVPYQLGVRGRITAIGYDPYGRLWVGSNLGTARFWHRRWTIFGYSKNVTTEPTTATALAKAKLGKQATPERIQNLTHLIIEYNGLGEDGRIDAGRTIYVYRNPAASPVYDLATNGDRLLIASAAGQLEVKSGNWNRYYHGALERDQVRAIVTQGGDTWFVTNSRIVIFKKSHKEVTFMHSPWLPEFNLDLYYDYFSYVTNIDGVGTLGAAVTFFSYGEIIRTDEFGRLGNSFHSFDGAFSLSYGTRLSPTLIGGLTAKVIYSRLADQGAGAEIGSGSATAFAIDAGLLYQTPWKRLNLGAALSNVGPDISYVDAQQSDPLPRNLALGFAYRLADSPYNRLTLVGELNKELVDLAGNTSDLKQIVYNFGAEYWYGSFIALRAGYIYDQDGEIKTPTLGAGLAYQNLQIDVAYIPSTSDTPLSNTARYSVTGRF